MAQVTTKCKNCLEYFIAKSGKAEYCCFECRNETVTKNKGHLGHDYIICELCKRAVVSVSGIHMRTYHKEYTVYSYGIEFPGTPLSAPAVLLKKGIGGKKGGDRMKEDIHRERLSKNSIGENNPMHRSKTTDDFRKTLSPFSPAFYKKKSPELSEEECERLAKEKLASTKMVSHTQISYWTDKGFTSDESRDKISKLQVTFSLKICVEKFGLVEGTKKWIARQEKWANSYKKFNYSRKSQELFKHIYKIIREDFDEIFFATLKSKDVFNDGERRNYEKVLKIESLVCIPDFLIPSVKKIIEFDGVYWHNFERRNKPENRKREEIKDKKLKESGYKILRISELDWDSDPNETLKKCIDFIYDK